MQTLLNGQRIYFKAKRTYGIKCSKYSIISTKNNMTESGLNIIIVLINMNGINALIKWKEFS